MDLHLPSFVLGLAVALPVWALLDRLLERATRRVDGVGPSGGS